MAPPPAATSATIPVWAALVPVLALVASLFGVLVVLPALEPGFSGSGHLPLIASAAVAAIVARSFGHRWSELEGGMVESIKLALPAVLILLVIGMLIGTWLLGGIVPALIAWGLALLSPQVFLPAACLVCSVVSIVSGSSWSTAGTVGLALVGVGEAMDIDPAMTAGAVISGAYFGDKLSPLSDTTNLAPAMAGTTLFTHIRHMLWTTVPAWVLSMILYAVLSIRAVEAIDTAALEAIAHVIERNYTPSWMHLVPPLLVVSLVMRRYPALPSLMLGVVAGALLSLWNGATLAQVLTTTMSGYVAQTGSPQVDTLLSRGGLTSMTDTVLLILSAMVFGGVMERSGMLGTLATQLLRLARSAGTLIVVTIATAMGTNILAADQFIAIVLPGRMYSSAYQQRGLDPKNLSRAVEDGGTITSVLVPWNTCGAFMAATLGVATTSYLPFTFFNMLNPVIAIIYALTGFTIVKQQRVDR